MNLGLTESLPSLVSRRFVAAKESGNLIFSATQLAILRSKHGIDYQLRYCPALAKKPGSENHSSTKKPSSSGPKPDPFENPSPDLLITEVPFLEKSHFLVLNKFPVIPNHFILATKRFESQTDLLEKEDLGVAYACLEAWVDDVPPENNEIKGNGEKGRRRLFAFFNSGEESGASQPHRHLQFLPIEDMRAQQGEENSETAAEGGSGSSWTPLIDLFLTSSNVQTSSSGIRHLPNLPFQHFALQIPRSTSSSSESPSPSADALHEVYLSLYRAALLSAGITTPNEQMRTSGPAAISYNLAMTEDIMMIVPRKKETATIPDLPDAGAVSLNGTILAGTLMVKTEEQWDHLRKDAEVINDLFAEVGIPICLGLHIHHA